MENITGMFCYSLTSLDSLAQYPDYSVVRRNQLCSPVTGQFVRLLTNQFVSSSNNCFLLFTALDLMHVVLEAESVGPEEALPPTRERWPTLRQPHLAELSSPGRERACTRSRQRCGEKRPAGGQKWYTEALVVSLCFRSLHSY